MIAFCTASCLVGGILDAVHIMKNEQILIREKSAITKRMHSKNAQSERKKALIMIFTILTAAAFSFPKEIFFRFFLSLPISTIY